MHPLGWYHIQAMDERLDGIHEISLGLTAGHIICSIQHILWDPNLASLSHKMAMDQPSSGAWRGLDYDASRAATGHPDADSWEARKSTSGR